MREALTSFDNFWAALFPAEQARIVQDLAAHIGLSDSHVSKTLRLAYLAPDVPEAFLVKRFPPAVSLARLDNISRLPWAEQARAVFDPP